MDPTTSCPDSSFVEEKSTYDPPDLIHGELKSLDVGLELIAGSENSEPLSELESRRLRRKIDWHILPLLCLIYTVQFIDKNTLAASSILGLIADNHLTTSEFNTLGSALYIGYLLFEWPQNWALQKFPVGRWLTFNIFLWCLFLALHTVCHNFGGLFILRFLLGAAEGSTTAGMMLVCSMFYTHGELAERLGWAYQCSGVAVIIFGFIQFGLVHTSPHGHPNQWQWIMIITALLSFVTFVLFLLFFPNNPTTAPFLTREERVMAVRRVQANQNGIETKTWKRYQMIEALREPRTWLFAIFAGLSSLVGGVGIQYSLLIQSFGFTQLQTTLLGIPSGVAQVLAIAIAGYASRRFPNARAKISILSWIPAIIGCLIELCAPLEAKVARLVGIYLLFTGGSPAFIMTMSWVSSNTSGHTKKMTTNAIFLVGYAVGQTLCSQFWLEQYKPANHVPFGITLMSFLASIMCTLALWYMFVQENKRRDALKAEATRSGVGIALHEEHAVIDTTDLEGKGIRKRVDKMYLDLTDGENLAFRYAL